jgi:Zn-dependent protease
MRETVRFGRVAGIPIGAHWSVLVVAALVTFTLATSVLPELVGGIGLIAALAAAAFGAATFLASIALHELGHALVARREGVATEGITLWMLGGVARLRSEPSTPGAALRIAVAGPAVSLALAVGSAGAAMAAATVGVGDALVAVGVWLAMLNIMLAVFNMIPALPLDGGRVLQALLWRRRGDDLAATITAAGFGRAFAALLVLGGFVQLVVGYGNGLWTMALGWFIASAAAAERRDAQRRRRLRDEPAPSWPFMFDWFTPARVSPVRVPTGAGDRPRIIDATSRPVDPHAS